MKFGSHLYGTDTPESDLDFKAVHLPTAREILLQRVPSSAKRQQREKAEGERNNSNDVDEESYSLQRFLELATKGETVALDMLFAPDSALLKSSYLWGEIRNNRHRLLTKKSTAFVGYCRNQANKYGIKGSRVAAAKAAKDFFAELIDIPLPTSKVGAFKQSLGQLIAENSDNMHIITQDTTPGHSETYFECCNRKVGFNNTVREAHGIFSKIYENYGTRARLAESNEGVDWKALSHAVRVAEQALELLKTSHITFPLVNAAHILDIKKGRVPYQAVAEEIEELLIQVEQAAESSTLPAKADTTYIDDLVADVYGEIVRGEGL
jgi:hypothetical protein